MKFICAIDPLCSSTPPIERSFFYSYPCSSMAANIMHRFLCFVQQFLPFFTTLNFTNSLPETIIPLTKLPYAFRNRITRIIPAEIKNEYIKACAKIDRRGWDDHKQVFITDNHKICRKAMNDTFLFRLCKCLDQFKHWRKVKDVDYTIYPVWNSVLLVDEILDRKNDVYVNDTLILHCQPESYEKVIPTIIGHYTRLELHGTIIWAQLKRLIHPGVKQVRVGGIILIKSADYDELVDFIVRHCRGIDYTFSFGSKTNYNHEIMVKLHDALRNYNTLIVRYRNDKYHVVHRDKSEEADVHTYTVLWLFFVLITCIVPFFLLFLPGSVLRNKPSTGETTDLPIIINIIFVITSFSFMIFMYDVKFNTTDILNDNSEATDSLLPI